MTPRRTTRLCRPHSIRGIGLGSATALNMIDMIGVGPFITMPLIISAMGGPQAMLGWVLGAVFAMCDGLVWAELGAAMPGSGGSYRYLREIYGPQQAGPSGFFSVHLAAFFQRAAFDGVGRHRAGADMRLISGRASNINMRAHTGRCIFRCSEPCKCAG